MDRFQVAFNALVNDTLMPDSLEMIALLRDHMGPEIRKPVANLLFASAELFDYPRGTKKKLYNPGYRPRLYSRAVRGFFIYFFSSRSVI